MDFILEFIDTLINWYSGLPVIPWVITPIEKIAEYLEWLTWHRLVVVLIGCDIIISGLEYGIVWYLWKRFNIVKQIRTPQWLGRVANKRHISYLDLCIFGFTPRCHFIGIIALFARRHELGWRGFIALELGSFCRLLIYPLLGKYIFLLVGVFAFLQIWERQRQNGNFHQTKRYFDK